MKDDKEVSKHPAYGTITVVRCQSTGTRLFDSDALHHHFIEVRVQHAEVLRDLSHNWIHGESRPVVEFWMTEAQWAQFVSSHGMGEGTPVTLRHVNGEGTLPDLPEPEHTATKFEKEVGDAIKESMADLTTILGRLNESLLPGAKVPGKTEMKELVSKLSVAIGHVQSGLPYIEKCFNEHMEETMRKAVIEFKGIVDRHLHEKGLEALKSQMPQLGLPEAGE